VVLLLGMPVGDGGLCRWEIVGVCGGREKHMISIEVCRSARPARMCFSMVRQYAVIVCA
jgi:hypothetical protein